MSAAARRAIIAATKKRWAAIKAAKAAAETPAPVAATPETAPAKGPTGQKRQSYRGWAMKKSWIAKKKGRSNGEKRPKSAGMMPS